MSAVFEAVPTLVGNFPLLTYELVEVLCLSPFKRWQQRRSLSRILGPCVCTETSMGEHWNSPLRIVSASCWVYRPLILLVAISS
jgi:hypothetical protein